MGPGGTAILKAHCY